VLSQAKRQTITVKIEKDISRLPLDKRRKSNEKRQGAAYGDTVTICSNAECIMRKKAKCSGFEGCPGFKGK
jgi:hypothetical protein